MIYLRSFRSAGSVISSIPNCRCFRNPIYTAEICVPNPGSAICCPSFKPDFCFNQGIKSQFNKVNGNRGVSFGKSQDFPPWFSSRIFTRISTWNILLLGSSAHPASLEVLHCLAFVRVVFLLPAGPHPGDFFVATFAVLIQQPWTAARSLSPITANPGGKGLTEPHQPNPGLLQSRFVWHHISKNYGSTRNVLNCIRFKISSYILIGSYILLSKQIRKEI